MPFPISFITHDRFKCTHHLPSLVKFALQQFFVVLEVELWAFHILDFPYPIPACCILNMYFIILLLLQMNSSHAVLFR